MKAWFVSDIHITDPGDARVENFEVFLTARLNDSTTHIFLLGDIFDFWVGSDVFFAERYKGVVRAVRALRAKAVEVIYVEGNHDLHLKKFWAEQLGCQVFTEPTYFVLGPHRVRVEHGDQMDASDTGYLVLRAVLRSQFIEWLSETLPGGFLQGLGESMSRLSRKWTSSPLKARDQEAIRKLIHAHAKRAYGDDDPFDFIFSGHVHVRDEFSWTAGNGSIVHSVNLGWWTSDEVSQVYCLTARDGRWVSL